MHFNEDQVAEFSERGYLFFSGLLDPDETAVLQAAVPQLLRRRGPEVVREREEDEAARLVFGAHLVSEPFRRLPLLPRLLLPCRQLLNDDVYLHQTRLNPKEGFGIGGSWEWHQDYPPWHKIDGMPEPRCVVATVFIDDCTPATSPLLVVPGSHRHGLMEATAHDDTVGRGYDLMHIDRATLTALAADNGIAPLLGPAGSVCFVDCNLVHGSANNVSPWRRAIMYLIYNAVSNACVGGQRAAHHHNRDATPLQPIAEDALKTLAP
jgi:ectoine hydroxylase